MPNGTKSNDASASQLKENAKHRLNDILERFGDLQALRKEGRMGDVAVLHEQVYQSLREWKSELEAPSPATSLLGDSLGSFSQEIGRMLQLCEEEDDATSAFADISVLKSDPEPQINVQSLDLGNSAAFQNDYSVHQDTQGHSLHMFDQSKSSSSGLENSGMSNFDISAFLDCQHFTLDDDFQNGHLVGTDDAKNCSNNFEANNMAYISPPPVAFMGPKCALWDCTRPAHRIDQFGDYCIDFHATLASNEGSPGESPVLRPGGIGLKDNLLFTALTAKTMGKNVGIPHCEGAATKRCPWNATELFDLSLYEGETLREWLFFDKPRRAFDSGNRKQRSLPDYSGRGWHESRKQVIKESGGNKRSYYMDPQPPGLYEWHLFEYEINNCDACALYRLELKIVDEKKNSKGKVTKDSFAAVQNPKGKVTKDPLAEIQKKMGRLTAEVTPDNSPSTPSTKANRQVNIGDFNSLQGQKFFSVQPADNTSIGPSPKQQ